MTLSLQQDTEVLTLRIQRQLLNYVYMHQLLVSCWSPALTSADVGFTVVDQLQGTPCQLLCAPTTDLLTPLAEH